MSWRPPQSPVSYIQLTLRKLEADPKLRAQVLSGVGLSPEEAEDPYTEIEHTQLGRLYENMDAHFGAGWVIDLPS